MLLLLPRGHALAGRVSVWVEQGHQAGCMSPWAVTALVRLRGEASVYQVHEHLWQVSYDWMPLVMQ